MKKMTQFATQFIAFTFTFSLMNLSFQLLPDSFIPWLKAIFLFVFCLFLPGSCRQNVQKPDLIFYAWSAKFPESDKQINELRECGTSSLALRVCDIRYNESAGIYERIAPWHGDASKLDRMHLIPVIHLDEHLFDHTNGSDVDELTNLILNSIDEILPLSKIESGSIQIDFDWQSENIQAYTDLISLLRKQISGKQIHSTITLTRATEPGASLPGADRYVLMMYDLGLPDPMDTIALIPYLKSLDQFHAPLDVSLPWFSRPEIIDSKGRPLGTINSSEQEIRQNAAFLFENNGAYRVIESTVIEGRNFSKDEKIRFTEPDEQILKNLRACTLHHMHSNPTRIFIFSADALKDYPFNIISLN